MNMSSLFLVYIIYVIVKSYNILYFEFETDSKGLLWKTVETIHVQYFDILKNIIAQIVIRTFCECLANGFQNILWIL